MKRETFHCCKEMYRFLGDSRVPIIYLDTTREYGLELPGPQYPVGKLTGSIIRFSASFDPISHCPWCGKQFFLPLRKEYFSYLDKYETKKYPFDVENEPPVPNYFKNDEWWVSFKYSQIPGEK
jgi:hypothetical protein